MNFSHMPGLRSPYGFAAVMLVMVVIAAGMVWWFRRQGWT